MPQTVPATCVLGPGKTGLTIGLRVLNLDGSTYAPFATTGVAETATAGTYRKAGGVVAPLAGGYIVWGTSVLDLAEATVESASANVTMQQGVAVAAADANGNVPVIVKAWYDTLVSEPDTAGLPDVGTIKNISDFVAQQVRDAMKLAPSGGAAEVGSVDKHLDDLLSGLAAVDANVDEIKLITDDLDVTAVTQVAASSAGHLTITAGLTFSEGVTGLTIPADWVAAVWTLKHSAGQADSAAVIQLRTENPAAVEDGLQRLNGVAVALPITAADGALTVTQASGRIDIWLSDELTLLLAKATGLGWDVKFIDADGDSNGQRGTADVVLTETLTLA